MLTTILIGAGIGAALTLEIIFDNCVVKSKKEHQEDLAFWDAEFNRMRRVEAENAKLRVALAAGEMTEEGKKIAAMTMAALDAVVSTYAILSEEPTSEAEQQV
jgi:hypothetical protein